MNTRGYTGPVTFTQHFVDQVKIKGFDPLDIMTAIRSPEVVQNVTRYPGQTRYCGARLAVIMKGSTAITVYLDGRYVTTPLRADQMNDPAALSSKRLAHLA